MKVKALSKCRFQLPTSTPTTRCLEFMGDIGEEEVYQVHYNGREGAKADAAVRAEGRGRAGAGCEKKKSA